MGRRGPAGTGVQAVEVGVAGVVDPDPFGDQRRRLAPRLLDRVDGGRDLPHDFDRVIRSRLQPVEPPAGRGLGDRDAASFERVRAVDVEQVRVLDGLEPPHPLQEADRGELARRLGSDMKRHVAVMAEVARQQHGGIRVRSLDRLDPITGELRPRLQLRHKRHYCRMARIPPVDESSAPPASRSIAAEHLASGSRMTNMKWTLAHSPVALDALLSWYPLHDAVQPFLGERRVWVFCHAISTQSDCLVCSTFFRRLLIDAGEDPTTLQLDEFDELIADLGRRLASDPHSVDDAMHTALAARLSAAEIVTLMTFGAIMVATNVFNDAMGVELDGYLERYAA